MKATFRQPCPELVPRHNRMHLKVHFQTDSKMRRTVNDDDDSLSDPRVCYNTETVFRKAALKIKNALKKSTLFR